MQSTQHYSAYDPRSTKLEIRKNRLHVNGRRIPIRNPDKKNPKMLFKGFYYETEDELAVARLLCGQNICAFHHPRFALVLPDGTRTVWSPDHVFIVPQLLDVQNPARQLLIHGLETKQSPALPDIVLRQRLLVEQYNVHIHIIYPADVRRFIAAGRVPLQAFRM